MKIKFWQKSCIGGFAALLLLVISSQPVFAHHALGGRLPSNGLQGFLSGLAHPIIGLDHLAFIVAVGLIASIYVQSRLIIGLGFIFATLAGTGFHLLSLDLPLAEIVIAASVLGMGYLLTLTHRFNTLWMILGIAIAGLFHGYAYGEAIMGAQAVPLFFYVLGFAVIQSIIVLIAYQLGKLVIHSLNLRFAGFTMGGMGLAFLASAILG